MKYCCAKDLQLFLILLTH